MNPVGDYRSAIAAQLTAAGVEHVTTEPVAVAPFVLVGAWTGTAAQGRGGWAGSLAVTIAVPPPGNADALEALETALAAVYAALGFAPARPGPYTAGDGAAAVPAYHLTYPATIPNPNC
jgi:hypothetical protein